MQNRVLLIVTLLAGGGLLLSFTDASPLSAAVDPETRLEVYGWTGGVRLQGGIEGRGETFVTSGDPGKESQAITAQGKLTSSLRSMSLGEHYHYRVVINGKEDSALRSRDYATPSPGVGVILPGRDVVLQSYTFSIKGQVTGTLRVELWMELRSLPFGPTSLQRVAYDGARLVDGAGSLVRAAGYSDIVEEGGQVRFDVRTGYGLWTVTVFNGAGAAVCDVLRAPGGFNAKSVSVDQRSCATAFQWEGTRAGSVTVTIPPGSFQPGGGNLWRVVLRNQYIDHAVEQFVTVDRKIDAPAPPAISISPQTPKVGETVTISLTGVVNPRTGKTLSHFILDVYYSSTGLMPTSESANWILRQTRVPASYSTPGVYTGTASFKLEQADIFQVRAYAVDQDGRMGGSSLASGDCTALRGAYGQDVNCKSQTAVTPEGARPASGPQFPLVTSKATLYVALALLAAGAAYAAWTYLPVSPQLRLGAVGLILAAAGAYAAWGVA